MESRPLFSPGLITVDGPGEDPNYLTRQLITYLGNKRALAPAIEAAVIEVRNRLGGRRLRSVDLFTGSGFVARLLKQHSDTVIANDLESYAVAAGQCFLSNRDEELLARVADTVSGLNRAAAEGASHPGFFQELYAPADDKNIQPGERAFYTTDNARRLDFYAQEVVKLPEDVQRLIRGPLLSKASVHANTGGVFKGFYKDKATGVGKFGATSGDALKRILAPIELEVPVLSEFESDYEVFQSDANTLAGNLSGADLVYIDPPYNQHPYGSNYFMLNLLTSYMRPEEVSKVSGIPKGWNRSAYNVKKKALPAMESLIRDIDARFLLVSFNSEGFISTDELRGVLERYGAVEEQILKHNTYRASRNLRGREIHVNEHLFLLDKEG